MNSSAITPETPGVEVWERPSFDTPVCVLHCDGQPTAPSYCLESGSIVGVESPNYVWGHNVLRCTDCAEHHCGLQMDDPELQGQKDLCMNQCKVHPYFCDGDVAEGLPSQEACLEQCVAECLCPDYCWGYSKDAARCVEQGGRWISMNQNFDNVGSGLRSLFEIATTEGWVDMMYAAVDAVGPMMQPVRDRTELAALFFVAFIFMGNFFVLNLCVGVIIDNFNKIKAQGQKVFLTESQAQWVASQKAIYSQRQFFVLTNLQNLPQSRRKLFTLVSSSRFENAIMVCICLNTLVMASQIWPEPAEPEGYNGLLSSMNFVLAMIFNVEAVLKILAMHLSYFRESWNKFDFCCVVATNVGLILGMLFPETNVGAVMSAIRLFRIARLFRLVRFMKGLNQLFMAFVLSVPKLGNVAAILSLLLFLFSVLGVNLFAKVRFVDMHNDQANFRTIERGLITLIRSMTGEAWNELMHELGKDRYFFESVLGEPCSEIFEVTHENYALLNELGQISDPVQCGVGWGAHVYFISYTILVSFVILNLFIAVIFEGFEETQKAEEGEIIRKCVEVWSEYDTDLTLILPLKAALKFVERVVGDVQRSREGNIENAGLEIDKKLMGAPHRGPVEAEDAIDGYSLKYLRFLQLKVTSDNQVHFISAVLSVLRQVVCSDDTEVLEELEKMEGPEAPEDLSELKNLKKMEEKQLAKQLKLVMRGKDEGVTPENSFLSFTEQVAAAKIQKRFHEKFKERRLLKQASPNEGEGGGPSSAGQITRAAG